MRSGVLRSAERGRSARGVLESSTGRLLGKAVAEDVRLGMYIQPAKMNMNDVLIKNQCVT